MLRRRVRRVAVDAIMRWRGNPRRASPNGSAASRSQRHLQRSRTGRCSRHRRSSVIVTPRASSPSRAASAWRSRLSSSPQRGAQRRRGRVRRAARPRRRRPRAPPARRAGRRPTARRACRGTMTRVMSRSRGERRRVHRTTAAERQQGELARVDAPGATETRRMPSAICAFSTRWMPSAACSSVMPSGLATVSAITRCRASSGCSVSVPPAK